LGIVVPVGIFQAIVEGQTDPAEIRSGAAGLFGGFKTQLCLALVQPLGKSIAA
jgi:hypothetical protein